jgi:murein L,D-transpeptidase YcbB/YkuD
VLGILHADEEDESRELVGVFYRQRDHLPFWTATDGALESRAHDLIRRVRSAYEDGLDPKDYAADRLAAEGETELPDARAVEREIAFTQVFFLYAGHLASARVPPPKDAEGHESGRRKIDLPTALESVASEASIDEALSRLAPPHAAYAGLRRALARYRVIARRGPWPAVPPGEALREGQVGDATRLALLGARLQREGFLEPGSDSAVSPAGQTREYGKPLTDAVRAFQRLHGIEPDAVLGESTIAELNVPLGQRLRQIELNMERWRWLPAELGDPHVEVNVASFRLGVVEQERLILAMDVIVGKRDWRTPLFPDRISDVVLNPSWDVPRSIAVSELLPKLQRNPAELAGYQIVARNGGGAAPLDPKSVDWSKVSSESFAYQIRQQPGEENALGRIKFVLKNPFDVYLHDTPKSELFDRTDRAFSHGCIRVEKPLDLAAYLLRNDPEWNPARLAEVIDGGAQRRIPVSPPVPIYIVYWTALVNGDGALEFHQDLYGLDRALEASLRDRAQTVEASRNRHSTRS